MALEIGASPFGNWSGAHACGWDRNAPEFGEIDIGDQFEKHSYPLGILVNGEGRRFVDEGADGQVVDHDAAKIPGLYAAGEMVGGIFYFNYPSGAGLVSGAVFGRLAGASAARGPGEM